MTWRVEHGSCLELLKTLPDNSVDSVVTDPPYGLGKEPKPLELLEAWLKGDEYQPGSSGFMGRKWDAFVPGPHYWREVIRVLKPGGHAVVFASTRTQDLMTLSLRLACFQVRDTLSWLYGEAMPHSLALDKAIDKSKKAIRPIVGSRVLTGNAGVSTRLKGGTYSVASGLSENVTVPVTAPATELAKKWLGWGTALKPCVEPIILVRKPLEGTIAKNVEKHGVGGLHIDACRGESGWDCQAEVVTSDGAIANHGEGALTTEHPDGRWPPNVCIDENVANDLDDLHQRVKGGVSRYFYCPKAKPGEREAGLDDWPVLNGGQLVGRKEGSVGVSNGRAGAGRGGNRRNMHPTVKPLALMRWLCRLITPPGGVILDPFCGSGTTGIASVLEGFDFIGYELNDTDGEPFVRLARARIEHALTAPPTPKKTTRKPKPQQQASLF